MVYFLFLGDVLVFVVRYVILEIYGVRFGVFKVVVILVMDVFTDVVDVVVDAVRVNRKCLAYNFEVF